MYSEPTQHQPLEQNRCRTELPSAASLLLGGDLRERRTSNVELDKIYQTYLPKGMILLCRTLPDLAPKGIQDPASIPEVARLKREIESRLARHGRLFFPIFSHHHWIAGRLTGNSNKGITLSVLDSAPSVMVHGDLYRRLRRVWPDISIEFPLCQRQERNSMDCGLFMPAHFFAAHLGIRMVKSPTLPARLRKMLFEASSSPPEKGVFTRESARSFLISDARRERLRRESPQDPKNLQPKNRLSLCR